MIGGLISAGGSILSSFMNNSAAEDRQNNAQNFSADQYAKRYQVTMQDMAAAGLNPMLAYQGVGGAFPTGSAVSASGMDNPGAAFNQGRVASAQMANIEADTKVKEMQAEYVKAQTDATTASAENTRTHTQTLQNDLSSFADRWAKLKAEVVSAHWGQYEAQGKAESAQAQMNVDTTVVQDRIKAARSEARALESKAKLLGLAVPAAVNEAAFEGSTMGKNIRFVERPAGALGGAASSAGKVLQLVK